MYILRQVNCFFATLFLDVDATLELESAHGHQWAKKSTTDTDSDREEEIPASLSARPSLTRASRGTSSLGLALLGIKGCTGASSTAGSWQGELQDPVGAVCSLGPLRASRIVGVAHSRAAGVHRNGSDPCQGARAEHAEMHHVPVSSTCSASLQPSRPS